ncbi:DUF4142 domain-containing protein [Streptomyces sp. NPDC042319]|uniref:DUF4142 domain-containing protein n=1 Tax=Streptomyces sp. NPDC042319 TaxID=3154332 RepID=UPI0033C79CDD
MRSVTGTGLVVAALVATAAALLFPILSFAGLSAAGTDINAGTVATRFGPLSALDRDFVNKVRLAGLWELPAGQQARERGTTKAVRTAGDHLVSGHAALDRHVLRVASQLGVDLPNQPNAQQQGWLSELEAARGSEYDRKFANILRLAHGRVFTVVAQVRATTRNSLVRGLADDANTTVLDHITVLERTGDVDFDGIARDTQATGSPTPPATPPPAPPSPAAPAAPAPPEPATPSAAFSLPPAASTPAPGAPGRGGQGQGGGQGQEGRGQGQENRQRGQEGREERPPREEQAREGQGGRGGPKDDSGAAHSTANG